MPTAVLDLELKSLPPLIGNLENYSRAFLLLRYNGRPVGTATLPALDGLLDTHLHQQKLIDAAWPLLQDAWLQEQLGYEIPMPASVPPATIAICTRNRTDDLRNCLQALQQLPNDGQEILVIDNAPSNDDTKILVQQFEGVRYLREERPGLNIARNRALKEAAHDLVLFTDDDAVPDSNWLRALVAAFDHPLVACVTGVTLPLQLETVAQEAFEAYSSFNRGFERKTFEGTALRSLSAGHIGAGVNMGLRKSLCRNVGAFDEALDAGTRTRSGGDHEYFIRILLKGYNIVYEPQALSWHRHRRTWKETRDTIKGYGTGVYAYWTRLFFVEREWGVWRLSYGWFMGNQLPDLIRAVLRRPGAKPLSLLIAELQGCIAGPWAYLSARRRLKYQKK